LVRELAGKKAQGSKDFTSWFGVAVVALRQLAHVQRAYMELVNLLVRCHGSVAPLYPAPLVAARQVPPMTPDAYITMPPSTVSTWPVT